VAGEARSGQRGVRGGLLSDINADPSLDDAEEEDHTELVLRMLGRVALSGARVDISFEQ
jgi:hypothetical protein